MADKKVIARSDITAKQMGEFWSQVALGLANRRNFQEYLELPKSVNLGEGGNDYLRCLSIGNHPVIKACDGSKVISKSPDVFPGLIDGNFVGWNADGDGVVTPEMPAPVFEQIKDGTFGQILGINVGNLSDYNSADVQRLRQMILTPHQIIDFCVFNQEWLKSDRSATFFPYESHGNFFVAYVYFASNGLLRVSVRWFEYSCGWSATHRRRFVLSRLVKHPVA